MPEQIPLDVIVSIVPHVAGTAAPNVAFAGVPIPDWAYTVMKNAENIGKFTPDKPIEDYTFEEISRPLRATAEELLEGTPARTTSQMGPSVNPAGGPPWRISRRGGHVLLEVDGPDGYSSLREFDFGISVAYYLEIEFA